MPEIVTSPVSTYSAVAPTTPSATVSITASSVFDKPTEELAVDAAP